MLSTLALLKKIQEIHQVREARRENKPQPKEKQAASQSTGSLHTVAYVPPMSEEAAKKAAAMAKREKEWEAQQIRVPLLIDALKAEWSTQTSEASHYIDALFMPSLKNESNDALLPDEILRHDSTLSNLGFSKQVYDVILPYAQLAWLIEQNGTPELHAYKLAVIFGDPIKAIQYILAFAEEHKTDAQPFHNACLFQLPGAGPDWDVERWRQFVGGGQKPLLNAKFRKCLGRARDIEVKLAGDFKKSTLNEIMNFYKTLLYDGVTDETLAIAEIFNQYGASQRDFDKYVQEVLPRARLKDMTVNQVMIPDMVFDGALVGFPGYYIEKMDHLDPMCARLGHKTGCCQSIGGQGEPCTIYGITHERSGFYVLRKGNPNNRKPTDDIKAQSWTWRGDNNALVLDSIEVQQNVLEAQIGEHDGNDLICSMFQGLAAKLIHEHAVPEVRVGTAGQTPEEVGERNIPWDKFSYPIDFHGYRDSRDQRLILHQDALWIRFIDNLPDDHKELFEFLNHALADNQDVEILKLPSIRTFVLWAAVNAVDTLEEFISQEKLAHSSDQIQLNTLMDQINEIQESLNDADSLLEIVQNEEIPFELLLLSYRNDELSRPALPLLHHAVTSADTDLIDPLINRGVDVNMLSAKGETPLFLAISLGRVELAVKLMKMKGVDLNRPDHEGNTPLMRAIIFGQDALAKMLIDTEGVDLNADNDDTRTALYWAVTYGNVQITSCLVNKPVVDFLSWTEVSGAIHAYSSVRYLQTSGNENYDYEVVVNLVHVLAPKMKGLITELSQLFTFMQLFTSDILVFLMRPSKGNEVPEIFQQVVKTSNDYKLVFNGLPQGARLNFMKLFSGENNFIQTFADLHYYLSNMLAADRYSLIQFLGDSIHKLIGNFHEHGQIQQLLYTGEEKRNFTMKLVDVFPGFQLSGIEFMTIIKGLQPTEVNALVTPFGKNINNALDKYIYFFTVLEKLPPENRMAFFDNIDEKTFENYFKENVSLAPLLQRFALAEHERVIDKLHHYIHIDSTLDCYQILLNIAPAASQKLFQQEETIGILNKMIVDFKLNKSHFEDDGLFKGKLPESIKAQLSFPSSSPSLNF